MRMRGGVAVLVVVALVALATAGHSKNRHLLDAVQKHMTSLSHRAKRLFVKGAGEHALWQKLAAGAGLVLITCTNMSCGGSTALQGVAQGQQYVRSPEEILGRHVHFVFDGRDYVGYVADATAADEISIDLYDGNVVSAKTHQVRGIRIETHPDEQRQVLIASDEEGKKFLHAFVVAVYDSNSYELMVGAYIDHDDHMHVIEFPYVIIVNFENIISMFGEPFD